MKNSRPKLLRQKPCKIVLLKYSSKAAEWSKVGFNFKISIDYFATLESMSGSCFLFSSLIKLTKFLKTSKISTRKMTTWMKLYFTQSFWLLIHSLNAVKIFTLSAALPSTINKRWLISWNPNSSVLSSCRASRKWNLCSLNGLLCNDRWKSISVQ